MMTDIEKHIEILDGYSKECYAFDPDLTEILLTLCRESVQQRKDIEALKNVEAMRWKGMKDD